MRFALVALLVLAAHLCGAETLVTKARILEITEKGFVLSLGTQSVVADADVKTKFWKSNKPGKLSDFGVGDAVSIRLKTDANPQQIREMADERTSIWLDRIRMETLGGLVERVDAKTLTLLLEDGSQFIYRHSEKSKLVLAGASPAMMSLKKGQRIYVKGRLLPTLDTWIVTATDVKPSPARLPAAPPAEILSSGRLKGFVDLHQPQHSMVDLYVGERLIHVVYTSKTKVKLEGAKAQLSDIQRGLWMEVLYRRDTYGRPIASQIELFHGRREKLTKLPR